MEPVIETIPRYRGPGKPGDPPLPGRNTIGVSVQFLITDGRGRWCLRHRLACDSFPASWEFGAGKVRYMESLEQALVRELMEEYGTELGYQSSYETLEPWVWFPSIMRGGVRRAEHWIIHPFIVFARPESVMNAEPEKSDAIQWFTLPQLRHQQLVGPDGAVRQFVIHPGAYMAFKRFEHLLLQVESREALPWPCERK